METNGSKVVTAEYVLPASEALWVGVLALVTGHAQSESPVQRASLAAKVVACLEMLGSRAEQSPTLQQSLESLCLQWLSIGQGGLAGGRSVRRQPPAPARLQ